MGIELNKVYCMDNLELLKQMDNNSVDLIYCDILYNTGRKFKDYNDNLGSPQQAIEWYRPRLIEMKRVLKDNGSIFLHCYWRIDSYIRILMDKIFGFDNFRNRIYRKHSNERGFYSNFDSHMDVILYYTKDKRNFVFNEITDNFERVSPLFENGFVEERSQDINLGNAVIDFKSRNKHCLVSKDKILDLNVRGELTLIDGLPYRKSFVKPIGNLWDEEDMLDPYNRGKIADSYDTPKPEAVLDRIIKMCSNEGDVIADFFLGGGTTAVVASKLNRKGIYCDISRKACDVTINKLKSIK